MSDKEVAVVTGGARGIGLALADGAARRGMKVAVIDLDPEAVDEAVQSLRDRWGSNVIGFAADVTDEQEVADYVGSVERSLGAITLYCSNAGLLSRPGVGTAEEWQSLWGVHVLANVYVARTVAPLMVKRGKGAIVMSASAAGLLMMTQSAPYTVTKHAAVAFAEWLAVELGDHNVQVHCICPQGVRTAMVTSQPGGEEEAEAAGALLDPFEVADGVFAAVEAGRFLILPHPDVHGFEVNKVADRDRWLAGMRRMKRAMVVSR